MQTDHTRLRFSALQSAVICVLLLLGSSVAYAQVIPGRILVKPKRQNGALPAVANPAAAAAALNALHANLGVAAERTFPGIGNLQIVRVPPGRDAAQLLQQYRQSGLVEYAEPDYELYAFVTPNDTEFGNLWGLNNTGQSNGVANADIDAPEAWNIRTSASNIVVAIVDTGVRYTHEDLAANMWVNPGEIAGNGIDDDSNGYVDDVYGINTVPNPDTGDPNDDHGHGSHVSGIIAAVGNNAKGVVGVAWEAKIMACKFLAASGIGSTANAITCIDYARVKGANIINASWGGPFFSQPLYDAIDAARSAGIIFVAAAGNDSLDTDRGFSYPQGFELDNIVSVAATTRTDDIAFFSSFGRLTADLGAPGYQIESAWNSSDSAYRYVSGTSMAAPHVSGAFALLKAHFSSDTYLDLIYRMYANVDPLAPLAFKTQTGGRLNIYKALNSSYLTNDNFASRSRQSGIFLTKFGSNVGASKESGEPNHAGNVGGKSVWWSWSPSYSGRASISTARSNFDTLLAVYTGSSVNALTLVASNDNGGLVAEGTNTSYVTFDASAGTEYMIAVDGKDAASGWIRLTLAMGPGNDSFTNSFSLSGDFVGASAFNIGATKESNEPDHAGNSGGHSVWWSWKAPLTGRFNLSTVGSGFDTLLAIYTGTGVSSLTMVATNDNTSDGNDGGKTSKISFEATAGSIYRIAVDGAGGASGLINLAGGYHYASATYLGGTFSPVRLNDAGQIAGATNSQATRWTNGAYLDLGAGSQSAGTGINANGDIVGSKRYNPASSASGLTAFLWTETNGLTELFTDTFFVQNAAVNDRREVVGTKYLSADPLEEAFYWKQGVGRLDIGTFGGLRSWGQDINNEGLLVGFAHNTLTNERAFLWSTNTALRDLGAFLSGQSRAHGLNDVGQVVGSSRYTGTWRAFTWSGGTLQDLGTLNNGSSTAFQINSRGHAVGSAGIYPLGEGATEHAAIWPRGVAVDLNYLLPTNAIPGFELFDAVDINASGQVISTVSFSRGGLLTPLLKLQLANGAQLTNGHFQFSLIGPDGTCQIDASTNLTSWSNVGSCAITNSAGLFVDTNAVWLSARYYRASVGSNLSINALGFLTVNISSNYTLIANPLYAYDKRIPSIFAGKTNIIHFWKHDRTITNWASPTTYTNGAWSDLQQTLAPGEAAMIYSSVGGTLTYVGELMQGHLRIDVPKGKSLIGPLLPQALNVLDLFGFKPIEGDAIDRYNTQSGGYNSFVYAELEWSPELPALSLGESAFFTTASPRALERYFSVW